MKKILFFSPTGGYAGIDVCLDNLVSGIDKEMFEVVVVLPEEAFLLSKFKKQGIKCYELPVKWWFPTDFSGSELPVTLLEMKSNIDALVHIIYCEDIELIISNTTVSLDGCLASAICCKPHLFYMHARFVDNIYTNMLPQTKELLYRFMGRASAKIICCSETLERQMRKYISNTVYVNNGIDMKKFHFMQKRIGMENNIPLNIVMVGHFNENKQQDFVLEALKIVKEIDDSLIEKIHFTAIGPGEENYIESLQSLVDNYSLNKYVTFKGFEENIAECLKEYNLYINSSITETLPLSVIEAMACGLPVLATPTDGAKLIVEDGKSGYICCTARDMAGRLAELLENDSLLENMSHNARERVVKFFSMERYLYDFQEIFSTVLKCEDTIDEGFCKNVTNLYDTLTTNISQKSNSLSILVVYPTAAMATFVIAAQKPLEYLQRRKDISYICKNIEEVQDKDIQKSDIVYCIRYYHEAAHELLCKCHRVGKPFLWYIDDNYNAISFENNVPNYKNTHNTMYEYMFENSDYVIVNNKQIYDLGKIFTEKIECLPTYQIITHNEFTKSKKTDIIRFGFMGTLNRDDDFDCVVEAIDEILKQYERKVEVEFIGYYPMKLKKMEQVHHFDFITDYDKFRAFFESREWDFAIAPLSDTQFNCSKTNNKYREYSSFAIPAIYSNISTYSNCIIDHRNGILVENNKEAWFNAIDELIKNTELRKQLGSTAKQNIVKNYGIQRFAEPLFDIFSKAVKNNTIDGVVEGGTRTLRTVNAPIPAPVSSCFYNKIINGDARKAIELFDPISYAVLSAYIPCLARKDIIISDVLPFERYVEYRLEGIGNDINFFAVGGGINSQCIIEIVESGEIVYNGLIGVKNWAINTIPLGNIRGNINIRFQAKGTNDIIHIIEIVERKFIFIGRKKLCGWIS